MLWLPLIIALYAIIGQAALVVKQFMELIRGDELEEEIYLPEDKLNEEIIKENGEDFLQQSYDSDPFKNFGEQTFSDKDILRIWNKHLTPWEKLSVLQALCPYVIRPIIKVYLTRASDPDTILGQIWETIGAFLAMLDSLN